MTPSSVPITPVEPHASKDPLTMVVVGSRLPSNAVAEESKVDDDEDDDDNEDDEHTDRLECSA